MKKLNKGQIPEKTRHPGVFRVSTPSVDDISVMSGKIGFMILLIVFNIAMDRVDAWGKKTSKKSTVLSAQKVLAAAQKRLKKARSLRDKGKMELAVEEYKLALQTDPSLAEGCLELGDLYFEIKIFESAAIYLESGLQLAEQQGLDAILIGRGWCKLAQCHQKLGKLDIASGDLVKAVRVLPQDSMIRKTLGDIHAARDRIEDAFAAYQEAVKIDPSEVEPWWAMGDLGLRNKRANFVQEAYRGLMAADSSKGKEFRDLMEEAHIKPLDLPIAAKNSDIARKPDDPYADSYADPYGDAPDTTTLKQSSKIVIPKATTSTIPTKEIPGEIIASAIKRLFDTDDEISRKAEAELVSLGISALPALEKSLGSSDPDERIKALGVLAAMGKLAKSAIKSVNEALNDDDPGVRDAANAAIKTIQQ